MAEWYLWGEQTWEWPIIPGGWMAPIPSAHIGALSRDPWNLLGCETSQPTTTTISNNSLRALMLRGVNYRISVGNCYCFWCIIPYRKNTPTAKTYCLLYVTICSVYTMLSFMTYFVSIMTSSNRNIFRVTGHLCEKFTGHRWISLTKANDAEFWCFLWSAPWINGWVNNREAGDLRHHRAHYDVIVMSS